jgi:hypothetical protein
MESKFQLPTTSLNGVTMGLMTPPVIRGTSVCNVRAGYTRDRSNSILADSHGIDDNGNECTTCNSSDFSQCPTHFGHMELATDDFAYVHFCVYLHRLLNVTCPVCSRMYMPTDHTPGTGAFRISPESAADQIYEAFLVCKPVITVGELNTSTTTTEISKVDPLVMYSFIEFLTKIPLPGALEMDQDIKHHSYAISSIDSGRSTDPHSTTTTTGLDEWVEIITHLLPDLEPCTHWSRSSKANSRKCEPAISCKALPLPVIRPESKTTKKGKTRVRCNQLTLWAKNIQTKLEVLPTWHRLLVEPSLLASALVHRHTTTHTNNNWWRVLLRAIELDALPMDSGSPAIKVATIVNEIQLLLDSRHWHVYKRYKRKSPHVHPKKWLLLVRQLYHLTGN